MQSTRIRIATTNVRRPLPHPMQNRHHRQTQPLAMSTSPHTSPTSPAEFSQTSRLKSPSILPPEALDLAAKIFNLARSGSTSDLCAYVSAGIPPNLTNAAGDTLLMLAAYHGHAGTTKALLDEGADPNVVNDRGQSPIAGAVFKGWDDVVKVLLDGGADIRGGHPNALDCARMFKRDELLELFEVDPAEGTQLRPDELACLEEEKGG